MQSIPKKPLARRSHSEWTTEAFSEMHQITNIVQTHYRLQIPVSSRDPGLGMSPHK